ncbi:DMT family transporter [Skermania piniformis]|uniref:DMT family transporter n=1 Tax=Skermania pinensis TaxID=39122 RepID=A0ABX8SCH9_9ACTN|nr:DMT family transporter [Skermania piniformis]
MPAGLAVAWLVGAAAAVQARVNGELAARLHDGVAAALISFAVGLVVLLSAALVDSRIRFGIRAIRAAVGAGELTPGQCLGGLCGAVVVATQALTVPVIGVALFAVALAGGQIVGGLVVDRLGLGPAGRVPVSPVRVVGAGLAVLGMTVAAADRLTAGTQVALLAALPAAAGCAIAWQQAVNGRLSAIGGPAAASLMNFVIGFAGLLVGWLALVAVRGIPAPPPHAPELYLGGLLGIAIVGLGAIAVRWVGVLLLGLGIVAGQLVGALLLDLLLPAGAQLSAATVAGCVLVGLGVAVAARPTPPGPGRAGWAGRRQSRRARNS